MRIGTKRVQSNAQIGDYVQMFERDPDIYTVLLMHYEGTNGSTTYIDSAKGKAITRNGAPALSSAQKKFGNASGIFVAATSDYLTLPSSTDWVFSNNDFTIDFWVRFNTVTGTQGLVARYSTNNDYWMVYLNSGTNLQFTARSGGNNVGNFYCAWNPAINTWYHIAVSRYGNTCLLAINGVMQSVTTGAAWGVLTDTSTALLIGQDGVSDFFNGYMDELRISKGFARWVSNFTPHTYPYEDTNYADSYTKLLLHCNGISGDTAIYDNEPTAKTITNNNVSYDNNNAYFGASSLLFNGSSAYLTAIDSADWNFGTGAFTIDFWVKFNSVSAIQAFYSQDDGTAANRVEFIFNNSTNILDFGVVVANATALEITAPFAPVIGTWYHIALVRIDNANTSTSWGIYVNGTALTLTLAGGAWNATMPDISGVLNIGKRGFSAQWLNGYLDEYRVTKGVARWFANFTPYSNPYPSNLTSIPITGLNGDVDEEYRIITRFQAGVDNTGLFLRLNNDSGANYGEQLMMGENATASALRTTGTTAIKLTSAGHLTGNVGMVDAYIYAKSGIGRTAITKSANTISTTTVTDLRHYGNVWNNSTSNITTLTIKSLDYLFADLGNGIGYNTNFIFLKKSKPVSTTAISKYGNASFYPNQFKAHTFDNIFEHTRVALDSSVKLLIHGNAVADATGKTVTNSGTTIDTSTYKFNNISKSTKFVAASSQYLSLADSADWAMSGDFTYDFWINFISLPSAGATMAVMSQVNSASTRMRLYFYNATSYYRISLENVVAGSGVGYINFDAFVANTLNAGQWYHMALVRSGNTLTCYLDGVAQSTYDATGRVVADIAASLEIGRDNPAFIVSPYLNAYLQEFRIVKGTALWTGNFTPPVFTDYGGATSEIVIPNLDGDIDEFYELEVMFKNDGSVNNYAQVHFNNDTGTNYGYQYIQGSASTPSASRATAQAIRMPGYAAAGNIAYYKALLYTESGTLRTVLVDGIHNISGTSMYATESGGCVWNNTLDKINSIWIFSTGSINGLGVGSYISLRTLSQSDVGHTESIV